MADMVGKMEEAINDTVNTGKPLDMAVNDTDKGLTPLERKIEAGKRNMRPLNTVTKEEQKRITSAGGKASVEARRKKKSIQEVCNVLLSMPVTQEMVDKYLDKSIKLDIPEGATMYDLMAARMAQEALVGNVKAFEAVRDSAGDKPTDKVVQDVAIMTEKDKELMAIVAARIASGKDE